jgi:dolichol-phosphate mannosyltransferase
VSEPSAEHPLTVAVEDQSPEVETSGYPSSRPLPLSTGPSCPNPDERLFSIVVPVYNEEAIIPLLRRALSAFLDTLDRAGEIVLVDDGSRDATAALLSEWARKDPRIRVVRLSRNFGHQNAVMAGLAESRGGVIGVIDGDLQDPPEVLSAMLERIDAGTDVIYGVRRKRKEGVLLRFAYWSAYRLINSMAERPMPLDSGDFCVMRRCVAQEILALKEQRLFLRGLRSWVGFTQEAFPYERHERVGGTPKYNFKQLWLLMRNGIYGFTSMPLRVIRWIGAAVVAASICYTLFLVIVLFLGITAPQGFITLAVALCFFGGAQLLATGIIGEYVARIYDDVRGRPRYVVREVISHPHAEHR